MTAGPAPADRSPEERLAALGLELPVLTPPLAAYVPAVRTGPYVYTAGQLPLVDGALQVTGKVGADVSVAEAAALARICALNALAAVASVSGGLSAVVRVVKVTGFVASSPDFTQQAQVINGASELIVEVFGEAGRHARSAVGMAVLPLDTPVEVELIAEVSDLPRD
jgi:enamine deaminase RidA (YjgF/YER057c/UK114 family)